MRDLTYYDFVLVLIPLLGLSLYGAARLAGASQPVAVIAGTGPLIGIVGHALFLRAPVSEPDVELE